MTLFYVFGYDIENKLEKHFLVFSRHVELVIFHVIPDSYMNQNFNL